MKEIPLFTPNTTMKLSLRISIPYIFWLKKHLRAHYRCAPDFAVGRTDARKRAHLVRERVDGKGSAMVPRQQPPSWEGHSVVCVFLNQAQSQHENER
jgi:hypothetical protein